MADLMQEGAPAGRGRVRAAPKPLPALTFPRLRRSLPLPEGEEFVHTITFRPRATVVLCPTTALRDFARIVSTNSQSFDTFSGVIVSAM